MAERKPVRLFRSDLASLRLKSCDVEVFARLYERTDEQAAKDLIEVNFEGKLITARHNKPYTRREGAETVFREYFGRPTSNVKLSKVR